MKIIQPKLEVSIEDEEVIYSYKHQRNRGRFRQTNDARELSIIRAEITTEIIIEDMMRNKDEK